MAHRLPHLRAARGPSLTLVLPPWGPGGPSAWASPRLLGDPLSSQLFLGLTARVISPWSPLAPSCGTLFPGPAAPHVLALSQKLLSPPLGVSPSSPMVGNPKSRWLLGPPSLPRDQRVVQSRPLPEGIFEEGPRGPPLGGGGWAKVYIGVVARASPACPEPPCLLWRLHSKWVIPKPVLGTPTPSAPSASVPPSQGRW